MIFYVDNENFTNVTEEGSPEGIVEAIGGYQRFLRVYRHDMDAVNNLLRYAF